MPQNDKSFECAFYPESPHGYQASQRAHDYWVKTLLDGKLPVPPKEVGGVQHVDSESCLPKQGSRGRRQRW
jgi:hypothetical protein